MEDIKHVESETCVTCGKSKISAHCGVCSEALCKKCDQILEPGSFSFLNEVPEVLSHIHYCNLCFDENVAEPMEQYLEVMEQAKNVFVFFTTQRKEVPLIKKEKDFVTVKECLDRDETILRLGFFAAEQGHNAIIEVEVKSEKLRNGAYQTSRWGGRGVPATVDGYRVELQDQQNEVYR